MVIQLASAANAGSRVRLNHAVFGAALPALALAFMTLAGCATDKRNQALHNTLMSYASTIRWGLISPSLPGS